MTQKRFGFETKFHSREFRWSFAPTTTVRGVLTHIEGFFPKVTFSYTSRGIKILSEGDYAGMLKPANHPADAASYAAKIERMHKLFSE